MKFLQSFFMIYLLIAASTLFAQQRWLQYTSGNSVNCLAAERDYIWAGTNGGVVKWNKRTGEYTKYTTFSGLADNYVRCIAIDLQGNKWFGTPSGLNKFDGSRWTSYTTDNGLLSNSIFSIAVDKYGEYGKILCATPRGLSIFDGKKWRTTPLSDTPLTAGISALGIDKNGKLWVGTYYGLWQNYKGWNSIISQSGDRAVIHAITPDLLGNVWVGTNDGVCMANDYGVQWYDKSNGFPGDWVKSIAVSTDGTIWFADYLGFLIKLSGNAYTKYSVTDSFPRGYANAVVVDSSGIVWYGTSRGLYEYGGKTWELHFTDDKISPSMAMAVLGILSDGYENIWIWDTAGRLFKFNGSDLIDSGCRIDGANIDSNGKLWTCHMDTLKKYEDGEWKIQFPGLRVSDFLFFNFTFDNRGNLWGANRGGVGKFDGNSWSYYGAANGLPNDNIQALQSDRQGNIWVGTQNGAAKFDGNQWTIYNSFNGLAGYFVWTIYSDKKGNVWIGTDAGVSMYDGANWTSYTKDNSPIDFSVQGICDDARGTMWFGGSMAQGAYKFDGKKWSIYKPRDGLASSAIQNIVVDGKGNVWFNTWGGISVLVNDQKINFSAGIVPVSSILQQNYPNPFNLSTFIPYKVENSGQVSLSIYNALGQRIRTLVDAFQPSGAYITQWDGRNSQNMVVPSGVYFYRLNAKGFGKSKPMLLLK